MLKQISIKTNDKGSAATMDAVCIDLSPPINSNTIDTAPIDRPQKIRNFLGVFVSPKDNRVHITSVAESAEVTK